MCAMSVHVFVSCFLIESVKKFCKICESFGQISSLFSDLLFPFFLKTYAKHNEKVIKKWSMGMLFDHLDSLSGLEGPWGVLGEALGGPWGSLGGPWGVPWGPWGTLGGPFGVTFRSKMGKHLQL